MKWGIHRYKNGQTVDGYERKQYLRDQAVYGTRGANRIQKRIARDGHSVSGARSIEASKINNARRTTSVIRLVSKPIVSVIGGAVGYKFGGKVIKSALSKYAHIHIDDFNANMMGATVGASVGNILADKGSRVIGMNAYGYSSKKYYE